MMSAVVDRLGFTGMFSIPRQSKKSWESYLELLNDAQTYQEQCTCMRHLSNSHRMAVIH